MFKIGCHLSNKGGIINTIKDAISINASTFAFFSRNPLGKSYKKIINSKEELIQFNDLKNKFNFSKIVAHAPYTMNLCSNKQTIRQYSIKILKEDILNLESIKNVYYNLHPGSHTGQGTKLGIEFIAQGISTTLKEVLEINNNIPISTKIILETMSGKGSEIGGDFSEIKSIMDNIKIDDIKLASEFIGVCLDTCHTFDFGYDIINNLDGVLLEFDKIIGLDKLLVIHLNDSKNILSSKKDRHEKIGKGNLGINTIKQIINHKELKDKIFILETPNELEGYKSEIELLKSLYDH